MQAPTSLRRPLNWSDFESLCTELWGEIWNCPEIQKNGRYGQTQNGVDVYGIPKGETEYYGIQAKGKDEYSHKQLTETEINREIKKAKTFIPPLKKFYFATTALKDSKIEEYIRQINVDHIKAGLFEVHLFSWDRIVELVDRNRRTYDWYVRNQNFKTNKNAILTFQNNSEELDCNIKFLQKTINFRQKIVAVNHALYSFPFMPANEIPALWLAPFDNSINYSYCDFYFRLHNLGNDPIENFKVFFEIEGEFQKLVRVSNWFGILPPKDLPPYNTYLNENKSGGVIDHPIKKILVSEETVGFDDLRIKPIHHPSSISIKWRLTSNDYKNSGVLKMNFITEIIKQHETKLVEDPFEVKLVEGEIEDYIERPKQGKK